MYFTNWWAYISLMLFGLFVSVTVALIYLFRVGMGQIQILFPFKVIGLPRDYECKMEYSGSYLYHVPINSFWKYLI